MYRFDTVTRSLALLALVAIALLTSIASADDESPTVAERYGPVAATSVPFSYLPAPRRAPAVAATTVPDSYRSAPPPYTSIVLQTDTYWFDVAMRYADAGDPFRPQIAAER